jgi:hypothetical protein
VGLSSTPGTTRGARGIRTGTVARPEQGEDDRDCVSGLVGRVLDKSDHVLLRRRRLQGVELAVEKLSGKEVSVPAASRPG